MEAVLSAFTFFTALLEFTNTVEAKYCALNYGGEPKYYECPQNEYCCNFGCCLSPAFHFYQLWYYWLLVIFMFLLCSGGGWWYRYWLQSRFRMGPNTSIPHGGHATGRSYRTPPRTGTGPSNLQGRRHSRPRAARVSYNSARDNVVLQRIWKGPRATIHRNSPPPSYSSQQNTLLSSTSPQTDYLPSMAPPTTSGVCPLTNQVLDNTFYLGQNPACPYYQLYGPPPSYESVVSEQRQHEVRQSDPSLTSSPSTHMEEPVPVHSLSSSATTAPTVSPSSVLPDMAIGSALPANSWSDPSRDVERSGFAPPLCVPHSQSTPHNF